MRIAKFASCVLLAAVFACGVNAQSSPQPTLSSRDANKGDAHDRPLGGIVMKLPAPAAGGPTSAPTPLPPDFNPIPPSEGEDVPPSENAETPPPEEEQTYYGEPVSGNLGFLLDRSGSINAAKTAIMRAETTELIQDLTQDQCFDIAAFNGSIPGYVKFLWGSLLPATSGNKSSAIEWVNGPALNATGQTPMYDALQKTMQTFTAELDVFILVTDGACLRQAQILAELPTWWEKFSDASFIGIYVGPGCPTFVQQMVAVLGGTYVNGG